MKSNIPTPFFQENELENCDNTLHKRKKDNPNQPPKTWPPQWYMRLQKIQTLIIKQMNDLQSVRLNHDSLNIGRENFIHGIQIAIASSRTLIPLYQRMTLKLKTSQASTTINLKKSIYLSTSNLVTLNLNEYVSIKFINKEYKDEWKVEMGGGGEGGCWNKVIGDMHDRQIISMADRECSEDWYVEVLWWKGLFDLAAGIRPVAVA